MVDLKDVNDECFPEISNLLDTERVWQIVKSHTELWQEDLELVDFKKWDVRYKPGRECAAHYRMFFKRAGEERLRHQAITVELPSPAFDKCRARNALDEKYKNFPDTLIPEAFVKLPELNAIAYPFPIDPYLPSLLEALDGTLMKQRFQMLPRDRALRVHKVRPRLISYTLGARATILYEVSYRDKKTSEITEEKVVGKLNARKNLSRELTNNYALWRSTHDMFEQAEPLGSIEQLGLTFQSYVEGEPLGELLDRPEFTSYLTQTAEALATLHSARFPLAQVRDGSRAARSIRRRKNVLKAAHPDMRKRVRALTYELANRVEGATSVVAPTHGDFHHTNILARGESLFLIDFDEMAMGDPAADAGRFIASLSIPSLRIFDDLRGPEIARQHFLKRYVELTGIDIERVYLFEAASYLTSAVSAFRLQRENWRSHIEMLIGRSEDILAGLINASLATEQPKPLNTAERMAWAEDGRYVAFLAKQGAYKKDRAEVHRAELLTCRNLQTRTELVYKLSGTKGEEAWQTRAYGYLRLMGGAGRLKRDLGHYEQETSDLKNTFLAPRPIGSSQALELFLYTQAQGTTLSRLKSEDWTRVHSRELAIALSSLHDETVPLQRTRNLDQTIKLYADGAKSKKSRGKILNLAGGLSGPSQIYRPTLEGFDPRDIVYSDGRFSLCDPTVLVSATPVFAVAEVAGWLRKKISREARTEFCKVYFSKRPEDRVDFEIAKKIIALSPRHRKISDKKYAKDGNDKEGVAPLSADAGRKSLYRTLLRACGGRIAVVGKDGDGFVAYAQKRKYDVTQFDLRDESGVGEKFDTIVLLGQLEHQAEDQDANLLFQMDALLAPFGTLVCCVPNEHFHPRGLGERRFCEPQLHKVFSRYHRVRPLMTQPMKWVALTATQLRAPTRANAERYDVMAGLCQGRILDLGCGPGHGTYEIAKRGCDVRGYDISERKIALAREFHPTVEFGTADILNLPDDLGSFDTVMLAEVIEHVDSETGAVFLEKAWQHVGSQGRLVVSVPNLKHVPHKNHLTEFSWQSLAALLSAFGTPQIVTDQPYRWLLMYVDRKD